MHAKYKICPTNALYSDVFTLQHLQYLYISPTCFDPVGSFSGTRSKLKIKSYTKSINSMAYVTNSWLNMKFNLSWISVFTMD
jgi:hypothetical protein